MRLAPQEVVRLQQALGAMREYDDVRQLQVQRLAQEVGRLRGRLGAEGPAAGTRELEEEEEALRQTLVVWPEQPKGWGHPSPCDWKGAPWRALQRTKVIHGKKCIG